MKKRKLNFKKFFLFIFLVILVLGITIVLSNGLIKRQNISKQNTNTNTTKINSVPKKNTSIHMSVVGDIMCHSTNFKDAYDSNTKKYDFSYMFENVKEYLKNADITIGNLETTFAGSKRNYSGYPNFNTPEALGKNLKDLGIDVLATANNHCMDKGNSGLVSTLNYLDEYDISHMGTYRSQEEQDKILIKDINGIKIAFLAFTYGTNGITIPKDKPYSVNLIDKELMKKQIKLAQKENVDVICVNMHWGLEYKLKQNSEQEELADFLLKNGADIILGSHPHVLEPMEKRKVILEDGSTKEGFVIYSLGNFISGQIYANTKSTVILDIKLTKNTQDIVSIDSVKYTPVYLNDNGKNSKSRSRYKLYDIEKEIENYDKGKSKISKELYSTLKKELNNIKKNVGEEL